jgi:HSP20 family protein
MLSLINRRQAPAFESVPATFNVLDEIFDRFLSQPAGTRPWTPAVDIVENDKELVVSAELPGIKMEDVEVTLEDGTLTLSGSRKFEQVEKKDGYHRIERSYGTFRRAFQLPDSVDAEKVSAALNSGVLVVTLPKKEVARPKTVKVEVSNN